MTEKAEKRKKVITRVNGREAAPRVYSMLAGEHEEMTKRDEESKEPRKYRSALEEIRHEL